jgi:hypothetical protein
LVVSALAIVIILIWISVSRIKVSGGPPPRPACYANQKTVAGSLEMYNLDRNTKVTVLNDSVWKAMKSGGYLQSIPQDPGQGIGSSANYHWTFGGNGITCSKHGTAK